MAIQSMTGFARGEGEFEGFSWVWEIRSVNGKGLDVRLRLPAGFEELDAAARKQFSSLFKRGNISASLQVTTDNSSIHPKIDETLAIELSRSAKSLQEKIGGDLPDIAQIMNMRGVVELEEVALNDEKRAARNEAILASLADTLTELFDARIQEGLGIKQVLRKQLKQLEELTNNIADDESRTAEAINVQLAKQVAKLTDNSTFDEQRLYQEAVILAAKADIQEELDRLNVHLNSGVDLLNGEAAIGRKLDFLAQEFNRECNTICSKSNSATVTSLGLDMKLVIDQFREQVQNME